jgi:hypothetical protein
MQWNPFARASTLCGLTRQGAIWCIQGAGEVDEQVHHPLAS